jgi:Icc-related predicted phosphoesterase
MRLLAFSDVHRDREAAKRLVKLSEEADVVVGAGDFASMHIGLGGMIETLSAISKPTLLVPGNNESEDALSRASASFMNAKVLHGREAQVGGMTFFGLGGGVPPTPFPWSFDIDEEQASELLKRCPEGAILIVHSPPKGLLDEAFRRHLGSRAIRDAIQRKRPPLALCGHIHQAWGREAKLGSTRVVNLGPEGRFFDV